MSWPTANASISAVFFTAADINGPAQTVGCRRKKRRTIRRQRVLEACLMKGGCFPLVLLLAKTSEVSEACLTSVY